MQILTNSKLTTSFFGWIVASLAADAIPVFFAACAISFCSFSNWACTGQSTVVSQQWSVDSGQSTVVSQQWSVNWAVDGGQSTVVSQQWSVNSGQHRQHNNEWRVWWHDLAVTSGPVNTWMGDRLRVVNHFSILCSNKWQLSLPSLRGR